MFYRMYLASVCNRRQWPDPVYEPYITRHGHFCKVRVNNREYCTDVPYATEELARDSAAMKAFMICRNFSHNDGMFPGHRPGGQGAAGGVVQGLPVAIGVGRRSNRSSASSSSFIGSGSSDDGSVSGGNSPTSVESGSSFEAHLGRRHGNEKTTGSTRAIAGGMMVQTKSGYVCPCRRATVRAYGRCEWCLRESGWA